MSPELPGASGSDADVGYDLYIQNNTIVHVGYPILNLKTFILYLLYLF